MNIRKVLTKRDTYCFVKADGTFTDDFQEAKCFADRAEAVEFCRTLNLRDLDFLLRDDKGTADYFRMPIC
jgi:hypothetical protein